MFSSNSQGEEHPCKENKVIRFTPKEEQSGRGMALA